MLFMGPSRVDFRGQARNFISAAYYLFKNSPARRAAFTSITNSTKFPKQFVGIRWSENRAVVEHQITMLNGLKVFVDAVEKKEIVVSKSKSYYNVSSKVKNIKLLKAKL